MDIGDYDGGRKSNQRKRSVMMYLQRFFLWLARKCGARFAPYPNAEYMTAAKSFVEHVDASTEPWEWKQRQCIRAMMNRFPGAKICDLNLAIEIAVQECS